MTFVMKQLIDTNFPIVGKSLRKFYAPIKRQNYIESIKGLKGFPFYSNEDAKKELRKIDYLIKKYYVMN